MSARLPLYSKVLLLALLNLCLLGIAVTVIVQAQFRFDPGSFLLAPAQNRIMNVAHMLALDLEEVQPGAWNEVLSRYAREHRVTFILFDETGERVAGADVPLPREVADRIPLRQRPREGPPRPRDRRPGDGNNAPPPDRAGGGPPAAPLFLSATGNPTRYWAGARIPLRRDPRENPHPATLILTSPSLLASRVFFDVTPWLTIGLAVILVSIACWLPFIRGMTRSVTHLTRAAEQIAEGRFEIQVPGRRRDEIGQLGTAVNRMAGRLAGFVNGQKRFLGGIAHELCNPIATIQFGLGGLERRVAEDQKGAVADIQEEVQHMSALVNELLSFSRAGMKGMDTKLVPVNLSATVKRVLEREASPGVAIETAVDGNLDALADPEYLFRALSNVVRNAVRYAGAAGPIRISSRAGAGKVYLTVADCGPGVPEDALEEIFAPFYRLDPSRKPGDRRSGTGTGHCQSLHRVLLRLGRVPQSPALRARSGNRAGRSSVKIVRVR